MIIAGKIYCKVDTLVGNLTIIRERFSSSGVVGVNEEMLYRGIVGYGKNFPDSFEQYGIILIDLTVASQGVEYSKSTIRELQALLSTLDAYTYSVMVISSYLNEDKLVNLVVLRPPNSSLNPNEEQFIDSFLAGSLNYSRVAHPSSVINAHTDSLISKLAQEREKLGVSSAPTPVNIPAPDTNLVEVVTAIAEDFAEDVDPDDDNL